MCAGRYLILLTIFFVIVYSFGYECPPLKWAKHVDEIGIIADVITDLTDTSFLCSRGKDNVIINKRDGSIIETKPGYIIRNNSRTHEGGFVSADRKKIIILNSDFEELWSKEFDLNYLVSVIQTRDSGYAVLGVIKEYEEFKIFIMDNKGDSLTTFTIEGKDYFENGVFLDGIAEVDNGIVIYGSGMGYMSVWPEALVSKYSFDGIEIWSKIFGGTSISEMITVENGVAFTGFVDPDGWGIVDTAISETGLGKRLYSPNSYVPLIYLNSQGDIVLNKSFDTMKFDDCRSIRKCGDLFFLAYYTCCMDAGVTESQTVIAVNNSGEKEWSKIFPIDNNTLLQATMDPRVQPFSSGELVTFISDTLYYYAKTTEVKRNRCRNSKKSINNIGYKMNNESISYTLTEPSVVKLSLLSLDGKLVKIIDKGFKPAGEHRILLPCLPKNAYLLKLNCNNIITLKKIILSN